MPFLGLGSSLENKVTEKSRTRFMDERIKQKYRNAHMKTSGAGFDVATRLCLILEDRHRPTTGWGLEIWIHEADIL